MSLADVIDARLEEEIERGAQGGPRFKTSIISLSSGFEKRNIQWSQARAEWNIAYGVQSDADFTSVLDTFYAARGQAFGFRFRDWADYIVSDVLGQRQLIGTGDGVELNFQLIKTYVLGATTYTRNITRPSPSVPVKIYVDDVLQVGGGTDYTLTIPDFLGQVQFVVAPAASLDITASFEFDIPVRFADDKFLLEIQRATASGAAASISDITLLEIREALLP